MKYETKAGQPSAADTYTKIIDLLLQLEDQFNFLGHLTKMQGEDLKGQGFLGCAEMMQMMRMHTTNLATGKIRKQGGYR